MIRNWLMFWLFHETQPFNFKEKTLPLESVSWHDMKPFLNYAKKMWLQLIHAIAENLLSKQSIFSSSIGGFKIPNFVKLGSKRSLTETFFVYKRLKKVHNHDEPSFCSDENVDVNNEEASDFESYLSSLAGTTKRKSKYATKNTL